MRVIKDLLKMEIREGWINWDKLDNKIHAALPLLEGNYKATTADGKPVKASLEDALTFKVVNLNTRITMCYKIFKPRFINGALYCKGFVKGVYTPEGKPAFFTQIEWF
jgi:hypothetical protein